MKLVYIFFLVYLKYVFAVKLGTYNVDKTKITVSGISSGAAMANQLHVAFSSTISGAGIVSGPSYYCAEGSSVRAINPCMTGLLGFILTSSAFSKADAYYAKGLVDDPKNLKDDRVYIYHGVADIVVAALSAKKNEDFYNNYVANPSTQVKTLYSVVSAHGFITNNYGYACGILNSHSYLNNCGYNQAYEILKHMYGTSVQEPTKGTQAQETLIEIDQKEFFPAGTSSSILMDSIGYLYVPKRCAAGNLCKLHISLHGCAQGRYKIGNEFAFNAGFNQVGDLNDVIILYPQAGSSLFSNPNGCWDWWGYTNSNYATKSGPQMVAIKSMIDRITGN